MAISPPIIVLSCVLTADSGQFFWLALLTVPIILVIFSIRTSLAASSILVQAIVLKMVEPPVLERLTEEISKKKEAHPELATEEIKERSPNVFSVSLDEKYYPPLE